MIQKCLIRREIQIRIRNTDSNPWTLMNADSHTSLNKFKGHYSIIYPNTYSKYFVVWLFN